MLSLNQKMEDDFRVYGCQLKKLIDVITPLPIVRS